MGGNQAVGSETGSVTSASSDSGCLLVSIKSTGKVLEVLPRKNEPPQMRVSAAAAASGSALNSGTGSEQPRAAIQGLIGMLRLSTGYFLLAVTKSELVGTVKSKPIYRILRVRPIPLHTTEDIRETIEDIAFEDESANAESRAPEEVNELDDGSDEESSEQPPSKIPSTSPSKFITSINRLRTKVGRQFVRMVSSNPELSARNSSSSNHDDEGESSLDEDPSQQQQQQPRSQIRTGLKWLNDRLILAELVTMLTSRIFYYSREYDLTNSLQKSVYKSTSPITIWDHLNDRFWFNKYMLHSLMDAGAGDFIMPIMQGFVQVTRCTIEENHFDFILISRRSCQNSGLRYKRRGADDDGRVANFVETEQIIDFSVGDRRHIVSFVQIRGSIPLFWSQNALRRKPVPTLLRSPEANMEVMKKHFDDVLAAYGDATVVSLVEQEGREGIIGREFRERLSALSSSKIIYREFDVHRECKGMKYENIKKLIDSLELFLNRAGYYWSGTDGLLISQKAVVRTNCMDCLDRTNVVQCAIARYMMNIQLLKLGLHSYPDKGIGVYLDFEVKFNNAWANNGDAISIAYTNTSALKGDVTRTGKRKLMGVMNDGANSLYRMYQNNFRDTYRQSILDYILGVSTFEAFSGSISNAPAEGDQPANADKADVETIYKIRTEAVETVKSRVLASDEPILSGYTVFAMEPTMLRARGAMLTEKVFLLTKDSYYSCNYDYTLDKLTQLKRVPLDKIVQIQKGPCFIDDDNRSEIENYSLVIYYTTGETRLSGTLFNQTEVVRSLFPFPQQAQDQEQFDIFKVTSSKAEPSRSLVEQLVARLASAVLQIPEHHRAPPRHPFVFDADITPLIENRAGVFRRMGNIFRSSRKAPRSEQQT